MPRVRSPESSSTGRKAIVPPLAGSKAAQESSLNSNRGGQANRADTCRSQRTSTTSAGRGSMGRPAPNQDRGEGKRGSLMTNLKPVDVAIIGGGWTGLLL